MTAYVVVFSVCALVMILAASFSNNAGIVRGLFGFVYSFPFILTQIYFREQMFKFYQVSIICEAK